MGRLKRKIDPDTGAITHYIFDGRSFTVDQFDEELKRLFLRGDPFSRKAIESLEDFRGLRWQLPLWKGEITKREAAGKGGNLAAIDNLSRARETINRRIEDLGSDLNDPVTRALIARRDQIDAQITKLAPPTAGQLISETMQRRARRQAGETPILPLGRPQPPKGRRARGRPLAQVISSDRADAERRLDQIALKYVNILHAVTDPLVDETPIGRVKKGLRDTWKEIASIPGHVAGTITKPGATGVRGGEVSKDPVSRAVQRVLAPTTVLAGDVLQVLGGGLQVGADLIEAGATSNRGYYHILKAHGVSEELSRTLALFGNGALDVVTAVGVLGRLGKIAKSAEAVRLATRNPITTKVATALEDVLHEYPEFIWKDTDIVLRQGTPPQGGLIVQAADRMAAKAAVGVQNNSQTYTQARRAARARAGLEPGTLGGGRAAMQAYEEGILRLSDALPHVRFRARRRPFPELLPTREFMSRALKNEEGAWMIDPRTGRLDEVVAARVPDLVTVMENIGDMGAAILAKAPRQGRAVWTQAMAAWEKSIGLRPGTINPHLDELWEYSKETYATLVAQAVKKLPTPQQIQKAVREGESGAGWWEGWHADLMWLFGGDEQRAQLFTRLLAATSRRMPVKEFGRGGNLDMAVKAFTQIEVGERPRGLFLSNRLVTKIVEGMNDPKLGPKIDEMVRAAFGDPNAVVVDTHMAKLMGFDPKILTETQREFIKAWFRTEFTPGIGRLIGVAASPAGAQARAWVWFRDLMNPSHLKDPRSLIKIAAENPWAVHAIRTAVKAGKGVSQQEAARALEIINAADPKVAPWVLLTADRPAHAVSKSVRLRAGETPFIELIRAITKQGFEPIPVLGRMRKADGSFEIEQSLLVPGMDTETGLRLATERGQQSILDNIGDVQRDHTVFRRTGEPVTVGERAANSDYHSVLRTEDGAEIPFRVGLDYTEAVQHPLLPVTWKSAEQMKLVIEGEAGAVHLPGLGIDVGREALAIAKERAKVQKISMKFDPATKKFVSDVPETHPLLGPTLRRLEDEFNKHALREIMQSGEAPRAGSVAVELAEDGGVRIGQPSWVSRRGFAEIATSIKLTNPLTHIRNTAMNTYVSLLAEPAERFALGNIDLVRHLLTKAPREAYATEAFVQLYGKLAAIPDATRNMFRSLKYGNEVQRTRIMEGSKWLEGESVVTQGMLGKIVQAPFRFLTIMDEYAKQINRQGNYFSLAYRQALKERAANLPERVAELVLNPTKEMVAQIEKKALEFTFQDELGTASKHLLAARNAVPEARYLFPFMKTPINVMKFFLRRTPLAAAQLRRGAGALENEEKLARIFTGTMGLAGFAILAKQGQITGDGPRDPQLRALLYKQGWTPRSIRVGDTWISYRGFEPLASFLAYAADGVEGDPDDKTFGDKMLGMVSQLGRMISDSTFVDQAEVVMSAIADPERGGRRFVENLVASNIVPAVVRVAAQTIDPVIREVRGPVQRVMAGVPGLSQLLPEKADVYGRPITQEGVPFLPRWSTIKPDPVMQELYRLGLGLPQVQRAHQVKGERVERTLDEYRNLRKARGERYQRLLELLVNSPGYSQLSDEAKKRILQRAIRQVTARER